MSKANIYLYTLCAQMHIRLVYLYHSLMCISDKSFIPARQVALLTPDICIYYIPPHLIAIPLLFQLNNISLLYVYLVYKLFLDTRYMKRVTPVQFLKTPVFIYNNCYNNTAE